LTAVISRSSHSAMPAGDARREVSVLVVDDDADIRDAVQGLLEEEGYSVATAPNGAAALEQLEDVSPRLILLDLTMPIMDGATFRDKQMQDESLAAIPTVVMTARAVAGRSAAPLLARACLAKPIDLDELLAIVGHYCGDH
jgi:CheY-like chemotaxis protein